MLRRSLVALICAALTACTATYNWREVRVGPAGLKAMMPCKPEQETRSVPMTGRKVDLNVLACQTGDATFAILFADLGDPGRSALALDQWKAVTLANMRSQGAQERPFVPPGSLALPQALQVVSKGKRPDGTDVEAHAAYFTRGTYVLQAVIYSDQLKPEVAEPFFSGLAFE
jgi:hypothetical protein